MAEGAAAVVKRWVGFSVFLAVVGLIVAGMMLRQEISDHVAGINYEMTPRVNELAEDLELTDAGRRIFIATHPTIDGSQHFNDQCAGVDHSEQGHVLGCYTSDRIHLFDVTDDRVNGIVEITAAHELLHAAFRRLGEGDQSLLASRLRGAYEELVPSHPDLKERMSVYEHLSESAFANELHSVLGTEVRDLPTWLEDHYAQWFTNRPALIDDFESYHTVFNDLQSQAVALQAEMTSLRADVERRKSAYGDAVDAFNADATAYATRIERDDYRDDPDGQQRDADALQQRRVSLDAELDALQADIDRYNALRDDLEALGEVSAELDEHLDSDLAPITTRPNER